MAYTRRKIINGHAYLDVVESYRKNGKVRHRYLKYLGPDGGSLGVAQRNRTFAIGTTGCTRYEFKFKIVEATSLLVSHDPFTFTPNPNYPKELQPRMRDRVPANLQVISMAAQLDADVLLTDFKSLDRGAPIVGSDDVVEGGNGRAMAILRAADQHPEVYAKYKKKLQILAPGYSLPFELIGEMTVPILVRERITPVNRNVFVEECNNRPTMESSPVETGRMDAAKLTLGMLTSFESLEGESITDAVRALRNKHVVAEFLSKIPENEQPRLLDAHGILNQEGVMRLVIAIFMATFPGDVGLRLSERFFESTDASVRNCFNGVTRSLGTLARIEALIVNDSRPRAYSIAEDLVKAITELIIIKNTPGLTVKEYLAQAQMLERILTPFQERVLVVLDQYSRSAKQIAAILSSYCQMVIDCPPPSQMSLISEAMATKEQLFETAVKSIIA